MHKRTPSRFPGVTLTLLLPALLTGCGDDSSTAPETPPATGTVSLTLPMEAPQELWNAFYGDVILADPSVLLSLGTYFEDASSLEAVRETCLAGLGHLEIVFTDVHGNEFNFPFSPEGGMEVELSPGIYSLDVEIPVGLIQNPFVVTVDDAHPDGYLRALHPDSIEVEEEDVLRMRVTGIQVEGGKVKDLGTLEAPELDGFLGSTAQEGGPQSVAGPEAAVASTFRPAHFVEWILLPNHETDGYSSDIHRIDADSEGHIFAGGSSGYLLRLDSSPLEVEKEEEVLTRGFPDVAVKAHGDYVYLGADWTASKLQRYGKSSFDKKGDKIDLDKWNFNFGRARLWTVSTNGFLFAKDFGERLVIANLADESAIRFRDFTFREHDGEPYDVVAVQNEYNYAFVAGERKGGSTDPGIYKISLDGALLRTFGHSSNRIPIGGSLGVDRKRNVYVVRGGGTTSGYFGTAAQAITVYDKYGEYLGYVDLSAIEDRNDAFRIHDIAVNLDDGLYVLTDGPDNGSQSSIYKFRLDL